MDAKTTLAQIGTLNLMAIGARDFLADSTSLSFRVTGRRGKLCKFIIKLDPSDTYSVARGVTHALE